MRRTEATSARRSYAWQFAAAGSAMTILFLFCVNYLTGIQNPWFIYPGFALLWWPLSVYYVIRHTMRGFSVAGGALLIIFICVTNLVFSPGYIWFPYAVYPVVWWPIAMFAGKKMGNVWFALTGFAITSLYYAALNLLLSPGFAWAVFPVFAVAWWPLSVRFAGKTAYFEYALGGTMLSILFFCVVNFITTPHVIWAIYPVFAVLWWPLTLFFFVKKRTETE